MAQYQYYSFLSGVLQSKNISLVNKYINNKAVQDSLIKYSYYIDFLYNYAIYDVEPSFTRKNHDKYFLRCEQKYTGESKNAVLIHSLAYLSLTDNIKAKQIAKRFAENCKDINVVNYLKKEYLNENYNSINSETKYFIIGFKNKEVFKNLYELIKKQEKQYTYIDFWASWCVPCRTEMPNSKKLKEEYINKGINFVYISTDENPADWEKAMQQIGLSETENYLLPKGNESEIVKKYKINSIPRYMIIDKDGKVINQDAPRPSDPKIRQIFDELLRK
jgi:thiol-disulfide isomerase/thioredoxin